MRDITTILAAGASMAACALVTPTIVAAVQPAAPVARKAFVQRFVQAAGDAPVSAVIGTASGGMAERHGSALPLFARY